MRNYHFPGKFYNIRLNVSTPISGVIFKCSAISLLKEGYFILLFKKGNARRVGVLVLQLSGQ